MQRPISGPFMVVIQLAYHKDIFLSSKLSSGTGHNSYGEPRWPNDILYIFPIFILGIISLLLGLAIRSKLPLAKDRNPFATPLEILPSPYLFPTFNLLRSLSAKLDSILSITYVIGVIFIIPYRENCSRYGNPFRRPLSGSIFLGTLLSSIWLNFGTTSIITKALPGL